MRVLYTIIIFLFPCILLFGQAPRWDVGLFDEEPLVAMDLTPKLKSNGGDYTPVISLDGKHLYFSRIDHPFNLSHHGLPDVWLADHIGNEAFTNAINLGLANHHSPALFPVGMNANSKQLFLFKKDSPSIQIWSKPGRFWQPEAEITFDLPNENLTLKYITISHDQQVTFASLAQEGENAGDLYYAIKNEDGSWTAFTPLPENVNSELDESFVFLAADKRTLYFSSNGHPGFGNYDLYLTRRVGSGWSDWSAPINLGDLVNGPENELSITIPANGQIAFFTKENEANESTIFQLSLPESIQPYPVQWIKGKIMLEGTAQNIGGMSETSFIEIISENNVSGLLTGHDGYYPEVTNMVTPEALLDYDPYKLESKQDHELVTYFQREAEIEFLQRKLLDLRKEKAQAVDDWSLMIQALSEEVDRVQLPIRYLLPNSATDDTIPLPDYEKQDSLREVRDLREKFNAYYTIEPTLPEENDTLLWAEPVGPEDFGYQVNRKLKESLTPIALLELKLNLYGEVMGELEGELPEEALMYLENQEDNLRAQIEQSLAIAKQNQWPKEMMGYQENEGQLQQSSLLITEEDGEAIYSYFKESLREEAKDALRSELKYYSYQGVEQQWEQDLHRKVEQQLEEEKDAGVPQSGMVPLSYDFDKIESSFATTFQEIEREFQLKPLTKGQVIRLSEVSFAPNTATLKQKSFLELDRLAAVLKKYPKLLVEIASHTNNWISHTMAEELTEKRARVVVAYLVDKGVDAGQLQANGYGKSKPIASNDSIEGRRLNQRVEMVILN